MLMSEDARAAKPANPGDAGTLRWLVVGLFFVWGGATSLDDILIPRLSCQGLVAFVNFTQTDKHTERTDNQVAAGVFYTGPLAARPNDDIGLAVARTHIQLPHEGAEVASELFYGVHAFPWLILRPNVQLIVDPGGYSNEAAVVILGLKAAVTL